jgi:iron complex outermembrane receptor protein
MIKIIAGSGEARVIAALLAVLSTPAWAADAAPLGADAAPAAADAGSEIVVTAQKRVENVQNVPATISVVGGERIERYAIDSAVDVVKFAPNANAWNNDGRSRPRYFIRGIGNGNVSNNAVGAVSVYNDDIYLNSLAVQGFPLFDLERVEILSGPQGTLQGKNSTAGSINFISRKPEFQAGGYAKAALGDYGQKQFEAAAGGPLIDDKVAVRAAVRVEHQAGTATNNYDGTGSGNFTDLAARLQLLAKIGDGVGDLLANVHYRKLDATRTATYVSTQAQGAQIPHADRDFVNTNVDAPQKVEASGAALHANFYLNDALTLSSITGYDKADRLEIADGDNSPRELSRSYSRTKPKQWSQELRVASDAQQRFSWIAGAYYFHVSLNSFASQQALNALTGGTPSYYYTAYRQSTQSYAAFANARFALTDALNIQGGLRWTHDRGHIDLTSQRAVAPVTYTNTDSWWLPSAPNQPLTDIARQNQTRTWKKLNWDAEVQWRVLPGTQIYGRVANGYRAGNFQGQVAPTTPPGTVDPETLTAYEGGFKSSWLDGALTFNADAFYSKYRDIQVSVVRPAPTGIAASLANAAAGYSKGIEAELRAQPVRALSIVANLGLLKTNFTSFTITNATANINGKQFARAPHVTGFIAADYTLPTSFGNFIAGTSWRYNSHFFFLVTDEVSPALQQDGYSVGDVRLTYQTPSKALELTLTVTNVTNRRYKVQVLPYSFGSYGYALGAPRMVLGSAKFAF